jgi:hypothetical protein
VWFRLVSQAALALQTAHGAGLIHGHLRPASFVFTAEGALKLCGLGEPAWLAGAPAGPEGDEGVAADLRALGEVAARWAAVPPPRKGAPVKPLPDVLQAVLRRLQSEDGSARYPGAGELLDDLDRASAQVPANAAAWERFARQVREASAATALRRSA